MRILASTPQSYLWILKPSPRLGLKEQENELNSNVVAQAIVNFAATFGIAKDRILFAERTNKREHIERHGAADLFLDTFTYGAHSTATDALRGVSIDIDVVTSFVVTFSQWKYCRDCQS
jgi:predicted O-linked N-acetylglucosamine transferase (SPINDLY family)